MQKCVMLLYAGMVVGFVLCNIQIWDNDSESCDFSVDKRWNVRWISCVISACKPHSHLHEVTTCGIWEAVPQTLPWGFLKLQECWNRALSHSDSSFRNAEESPNKDTTWAVGTMPLLLCSEGNVMPEKSLTRPCFCNKIFGSNLQSFCTEIV